MVLSSNALAATAALGVNLWEGMSGLQTGIGLREVWPLAGLRRGHAQVEGPRGDPKSTQLVSSWGKVT